MGVRHDRQFRAGTTGASDPLPFLCHTPRQEVRRAKVVDFEKVSTAGLESSPYPERWAG
jgi:hypothetical protein